jgi:hypothetical protein
MQITKITDKSSRQTTLKHKSLSTEELQREFDYYRAEKLLHQMLDKGLISKEEFNKIMLLNRETFSPVLARIMPNIP